MGIHVPVTRIDNIVNEIVDVLEAGGAQRALEMLQALPWGLILIDEARAAIGKFAPTALDELDIG